MALPDLTETVIVLDLDDTLYREADYHASGMRAVAQFMRSTYGAPDASLVDDLITAADCDKLEALTRAAGLPVSVKESLLWIYRLHTPAIMLDESIRKAIVLLEASSRAVAILTDGRSVTQRLKLRALGLAHLPAYISEEYGSEKPHPARFQQIMTDFPAKKYIYVGDNPRKDFVAPNRLGWRTIGIQGDTTNIHSQDCKALPSEFHPQQWLASFSYLTNALC